MEQVPRVGIVGSGKLARHLSYYFQLLDIHPQLWTTPRVAPDISFAPCDIVFLAVSDSAIESVAQNFKDSGALLIHCSGALSIKGVMGVHPLMTFSTQFYHRELYEKIPLIIEESEEFHFEYGNRCLSFLPNPKRKIGIKDKPLYHALCVLGGNFSTMLWSEVFKLGKDINLNPELFYPYLQQITENLKTQEDVLTGPIVRKDEVTIAKNLKALEISSYKHIYESFLRL